MTAGIVFHHAGATAPVGALICDGQEVSKTTYDVLFAAIGTLWDTFNGAATPGAGNFRVPAQATGTEQLHPCADDTGVAVGGFLATSNLSHTHSGSTDNPGDHTHVVRFNRDSDTAWSGSTFQLCPSTGSLYGNWLESAGGHGHTITPGNEGGADNRPDSIVTLLCIWAE